MNEPDTRIFDLFEHSEEYPKGVAERGVENNTMYSYISNTFVNGFVNYIEIFWSCVIERYEVWDMEVVNQTVQAASSHVHTDYKGYGDDCLLLGETENCYWLIWFDLDVSDCMIGRMDKAKSTPEELIAFVKAFIESHDAPINRGKNTEGITGRFIELPKPTGWLSF